MQDNLGWMVSRVVRVSFTPVIADGIGEDAAVVVERSRSYRASGGKPLQPVMGILVPETKCAVCTSSAEYLMVARVK